MHPGIYLLGVRLAHVQNLLDWADKLFTRDTSESVNRARELYELAGQILETANWPAEGCGIDLRALATMAGARDITPRQQRRLRDYLRQLSSTATKQTQTEVHTLLSGKSPAESKLAGLARLAVRDANRAGTLQQVRAQASSTQAEARRLSLTGKVAAQLPDAVISRIAAASAGLDEVTIGHEFPGPDLRFCLPSNPMARLLRWRAETNLAKIRTNRNFAGMSRQLQPYATPVDPKKLVKQAASGGIDFEEYVPSLPPPIYRFSFLIERARQLAQSAQQFESAALAAIEKADAAKCQVMQAKQDLRLGRANVTLQTLRVKEANDGSTLAAAQKVRAADQAKHFGDLISTGQSGAEQAAQTFMFASIALNSMAAAALVTPGERLSSLASAAQVSSSLSATMAAYDRRLEEWRFQQMLANDDVAIADAGIVLAADRIDITEQEKTIAELRLEGANDAVEFLQNERFTKEALYLWMNGELRRLYRNQLNLAISAAKAAQRALEFERQTSLDLIAYDYWDESRQGLVGAEHLLKDIEKLNDYRLATATRRKEIEKTISLASVMPAEFQKFRKTGVLDFETAMNWFDGDFPGHYMRLIRDVNVSVLALVPPNQGIRATLSNAGMSRVMVGAPFERESVLYRLPESVAFSSATRATGLFELRPDDPMLLPFEGSGVATTWRLEMPKGANRFDYDTLYDVLFTVRYTASEDRDYRGKVLAAMGQDENGFVKAGAVRYFSLRNHFPDQWYQLLNPVLGQPAPVYWNPASEQSANGKPQLPLTAVLDLSKSDFIPNEEQRKVKKITLALQTADGSEPGAALPICVAFKETAAAPAPPLSAENPAARLENFNGKEPYGRWVLTPGLGVGPNGTSCSSSSTMGPDQIKKSVAEIKKWTKDIWLIVDYQAAVHYNR